MYCKKDLIKNKYFYTAIFITFLIYLPNFIWNYNHHFIMFHHIVHISHIENKNYFHLNHLLEFLGGQFLIFGPIFFAIYILKAISLYKFNKTLSIFSYIFLIIISFQAFLEKAQINWALPTYIAASILVTAYLIIKNKNKLLYLSIFINIFLSLFIYFFHPICKYFDIKLTKKEDFYHRVLGWRESAKKIEKIIKTYPSTPLLFNDRATMSEMMYYLNKDGVIFNPSKKVINQFAINTNLNNYKNRDLILIIKNKKINHIKKYFNNCKSIGRVTTQVDKDFKRSFFIFYCKKFKGY